MIQGLAPILLSLTLTLPAAAQTPAPGGLAAARAALAAGRYEEALTATKGMEDSKDALRVQVQAQVGLGQFAKALDAFDALSGLERGSAPPNDLLVTIGRGVLGEITTRPDPFAGLEACRVLLNGGKQKDPCAARLAEQAKSDQTPVPVRLMSYAVLASAGQADARTQFLQIAKAQTGTAQRAVIAAARDLPAQDAVAVIAPALANPASDIQYAAALALGDHASPEGRKALDDYLKGTPDRRVIGAAVMSLALMGDEARMKEVIPTLEYLQGGDLLKVGEYLAARKDPRGDQMLERAARDDRELIRIAAAGRLADRNSALAKPIFQAAIESTNPFSRAAALQEFRTTSLMTVATARGYLLDADAMVRVRAGEALMTKLGAAPAAGAAAPGARR